MEIIRTYPLLCFLTVLVPFLAGCVTAYIAWDNLKERLRTDRHHSKVESTLGAIQTQVGELTKHSVLNYAA